MSTLKRYVIKKDYKDTFSKEGRNNKALKFPYQIGYIEVHVIKEGVTTELIRTIKTIAKPLFCITCKNPFSCCKSERLNDQKEIIIDIYSKIDTMVFNFSGYNLKVFFTFIFYFWIIYTFILFVNDTYYLYTNPNVTLQLYDETTDTNKGALVNMKFTEFENSLNQNITVFDNYWTALQIYGTTYYSGERGKLFSKIPANVYNEIFNDTPVEKWSILLIALYRASFGGLIDYIPVVKHAQIATFIRYFQNKMKNRMNKPDGIKIEKFYKNSENGGDEGDEGGEGDAAAVADADEAANTSDNGSDANNAVGSSENGDSVNETNIIEQTYEHIIASFWTYHITNNVLAPEEINTNIQFNYFNKTNPKFFENLDVNLYGRNLIKLLNSIRDYYKKSTYKDVIVTDISPLFVPEQENFWEAIKSDIEECNGISKCKFFKIQNDYTTGDHKDKNKIFVLSPHKDGFEEIDISTKLQNKILIEDKLENENIETQNLTLEIGKKDYTQPLKKKLFQNTDINNKFLTSNDLNFMSSYIFRFQGNIFENTKFHGFSVKTDNVINILKTKGIKDLLHNEVIPDSTEITQSFFVIDEKNNKYLIFNTNHNTEDKDYMFNINSMIPKEENTNFILSYLYSFFSSSEDDSSNYNLNDVLKKINSESETDKSINDEFDIFTQYLKKIDYKNLSFSPSYYSNSIVNFLNSGEATRNGNLIEYPLSLDENVKDDNYMFNKYFLKLLKLMINDEDQRNKFTFVISKTEFEGSKSNNNLNSLKITIDNNEYVLDTKRIEVFLNGIGELSILVYFDKNGNEYEKDCVEINVSDLQAHNQKKVNILEDIYATFFDADDFNGVEANEILVLAQTPNSNNTQSKSYYFKERDKNRMIELQNKLGTNLVNEFKKQASTQKLTDVLGSVFLNENDASDGE